MGMGGNFRKSTERVLFGVRGNLRTREAARSIGDSFDAPVIGQHSAKPKRFYEIVKAASYSQFGEVFQREPHDGFVQLHYAGSGFALAAQQNRHQTGRIPAHASIVPQFERQPDRNIVSAW
jgi:N6-adenosine-specific RNA methylase IME4